MRSLSTAPETSFRKLNGFRTSAGIGFGFLFTPINQFLKATNTAMTSTNWMSLKPSLWRLVHCTFQLAWSTSHQLLVHFLYPLWKISVPVKATHCLSPIVAKPWWQPAHLRPKCRYVIMAICFHVVSTHVDDSRQSPLPSFWPMNGRGFQSLRTYSQDSSHFFRVSRESRITFAPSVSFFCFHRWMAFTGVCSRFGHPACAVTLDSPLGPLHGVNFGWPPASNLWIPNLRTCSRVALNHG